MTRYDITAIGEGGLRLSVPSGTRLERTPTLDVNVAGTEANVLSGLASLGWRAGWVSALPKTPMARRVEFELRSHGVDLAGVVRTDTGRLGTYYVEYGAAPRPTHVYFDRADTAFTQMTTADVDWDLLLDTRVIHLTGITAALSPNVLEILTEVLDRAEAAGVPVSFDVNYRANLWPADVAAEVLRPFVERAEILFVRADDLAQLYDLGPEPEQALDQVCAMTRARHVALTCGDLGVLASIDGARVKASARPVDIVDRLGAGDGFAAGFLHAWLDGDVDEAAEHGVVMAALALAQVGEQVVTTREELAATLLDSASRLRR
ncbi:sugar kinase [Actinotalea ferrariae]|uniref:sugar kinase n=1 Tax=Actinotalea ferrariae TaxID=1386098 RepID=UPI001C8B4587|nr:sugar kinase [Actinotalea ferrariae]MBX9244150.1 sugar kinase [Actinotalea ferrariae]